MAAFLLRKATRYRGHRYYIREGAFLKKAILKFFIYFSIFFISNLISDILFKPHIYFLTAFSTAFGISLGIATIELYINKKSKEV
ncbi:hypothetical protein B1B01_25385 [Priestia filamentosa]|nr:hypothetical protein B1B01_25385 [Priestia filamentosa]